MKYMLLIYSDESTWTDGEREDCYTESTKLTQDLHAKGQFLGASPLHMVSTATSVRIRDGKELVTDGPFAETHEQLGGYFLVEAKNLDEATSIAARIPSARTGTIEVRPLVEIRTEASATLEKVFREEYGRIIATLIRQSGSFDLAEEALNEAFVAAAAGWERDGSPRNPGA